MEHFDHPVKIISQFKKHPVTLISTPNYRKIV